jgi:hypothetical protein
LVRLSAERFWRELEKTDEIYKTLDAIEAQASEAISRKFPTIAARLDARLMKLLAREVIIEIGRKLEVGSANATAPRRKPHPPADKN